MSDVPPEVERLLAGPPEEFVAERKRVARELRAKGRPEDATAIEGLRKPTAVVLAVNRAARDRPKAAEQAVDAALRVRQTQLSGEQHAYRQASEELERALDLLAEVAIAHVAPPGKPPTDAMRRRVRDLLRSAVADDEARDALLRGVLTDEKEAAGFASFEGMSLPAAPKKRKAEKPGPTARRARQARENALRDDLGRAERALRAAERSLEKAVRERDKAEKAVTAARRKLERLRA